MTDTYRTMSNTILIGLVVGLLSSCTAKVVGLGPFWMRWQSLGAPPEKSSYIHAISDRYTTIGIIVGTNKKALDPSTLPERVTPEDKLFYWCSDSSGHGTWLQASLHFYGIEYPGGIKPECLDNPESGFLFTRPLSVLNWPRNILDSMSIPASGFGFDYAGGPPAPYVLLANGTVWRGLVAIDFSSWLWLIGIILGSIIGMIKSKFNVEGLPVSK